MARAERLPEIRAPKSVADNPDALELMRVWWNGMGPEMVFRPAFESPRSFGRVLAEASQHLAQVYAAKVGLDAAEAHALILEGWAEGQERKIVTKMEAPSEAPPPAKPPRRGRG